MHDLSPEVVEPELADGNDAFVTHNVESACESLLAHAPEIHGPPRYITPDWVSAKRSVETLAALESEFVLTGHGHPLRGPEMRAALHLLARDFDRIALPAHGRYVAEPARADESVRAFRRRDARACAR